MNIYDPLYKQIANLPNEIWKDIPDFEDAYEVSSAGRVRSKDRYIVAKDGSVRYVKPKILTPTSVNSGYRRNTVCYGVTLASNGKDKHHYCRSIKNLVADAFLHKDDVNIHLVTIDDPFDFCADNLIYVSHDEFAELTK